jgi:hypothetical protein
LAILAAIFGLQEEPAGRSICNAFGLQASAEMPGICFASKRRNAKQLLCILVCFARVDLRRAMQTKFARGSGKAWSGTVTFQEPPQVRQPGKD